jgi:1,4-alpha-glucan branching enzyme
MSIHTARTIGAWPAEGGYEFRVWAPNATEVRLLLQSGELWDFARGCREEPLKQDEAGYWSALAGGVEPAMLYRYAISFDGITRQKLDPAARDVIHSGLSRHDPDNRNACLVPQPDATDWAPFETPSFENFLIYQLHVGSFAGRNDGLTDDDVAGFEEVQAKFGYIREMGFNAIELLPVHEFSADRSWGYNPGSFFAPESAYGTPQQLRDFVNRAHQEGLAMIFDVVYNHAGPQDSVLWRFDGADPRNQGGIYFEGGKITNWGRGPAWWKREVRDFFFENACMFIEEYRADGLRFDATTQIDGTALAKVVAELRLRYPDKYLIAEHLPAHRWITTIGNFAATWFAKSHHECQRALNGDQPVNRVKSFLGWDGFENAWNLVKYTMGSHDDCGDQEDGDAEHGLSSWDSRHRYLADQFGGRGNWHARAKCRLAWALNVAMPGTPMLFMGSECHMGAPAVAWGYWHDGEDWHGDHRFDWSIAGDPVGMQMRRLVSAANQARWHNPALRSETLAFTHEDHHNQVLAFKRWQSNNVILTVVNLGEGNFENHAYGVDTGGQSGRWTQVLCTQDAAFGGWEAAGNAFHEPTTQGDGRIYINLPKWSVVMFRLA